MITPHRTWRTRALIAVGLAAWVAALRGPFLQAGQINHDDALYWLIGNAWRQGDLPYGRYWDLKPPGLYLLYDCISTLFGARPEGARLLVMASVWLTSLALWRLGEVEFRNRAAGLLAAAVYVPYTLVWYGLACEPEMFIAPLSAWSLAITLAAVKPNASRQSLKLFAVGLMMGAAMMLKQTAVFEAVLPLVIIAIRARRIDCLAAYCAGAAVPGLSFLVVFATYGQTQALFAATVLSALRRVGGDTPVAEAPVQFLILLWPGAPLVAGALVAFLERRALAGRGPFRVLFVWIVLVTLGIMAMHATYQYYYHALLAPLALLSGLASAALWRGASIGSRVGSTALIGTALVFPAVWFPSTGEAVLSRAHTPTVLARYLAAQTHGAGGTLYVVDYQPIVYQLSGLTPATRYPLPMQLVCPFPAASGAPEREIARTMASRPDFVVVSASRAVLLCEIPARAALALRLGGGEYRLDRRFRDEMMGTIEVWRRREGGGG